MIVVTGATGQVGSALARRLIERGEKVRCLILPGKSRISLEGLDAQTVQGNVTDRSSLLHAYQGVRGCVPPGRSHFDQARPKSSRAQDQYEGTRALGYPHRMINGTLADTLNWFLEYRHALAAS